MEPFPITVAIPVYNSANYLPVLLSLLAKQSFCRFNCVFIYDKGVDGTFEILEKFCSSSNGERIHSQILKKEKKEGVGRARDFLLESADLNTKYVIFLDSDDAFENNFLEKLFSVAEKTNADITMCGFDRKDIEKNRIISTEMIHNPDVITDLKDSPIIPYLNPAPWNKLYRVDKIRDARFILPGGGEDEMFFLKVLPNCNKIAFVNEVLYHYAIHQGSVLSATDSNLYEKAKLGYKSLIDFYKSHGESYASFLPLCQACIFIRFGIGLTTRTCLSSPKEKRKIIKETRIFLNENLYGWKRNRLLSLFVSLKNGIKPLFIWFCRFLYKINCFSLFVFDYKLFVRLFRKDIKW